MCTLSLGEMPPSSASPLHSVSHRQVHSKNSAKQPLGTMSAAASPKLHLKKSPTLKDKDWEPFKSLIINLHITKGYSIKQVQQHMKDKHDFVARYAPIDA